MAAPPDTQEWLDVLGALRGEGLRCVSVVVAAVQGSAPREPGARMIVTAEGLRWGTVGGGRLEQLGIEHAGELLSRDQNVSESRAYPLAESAGQCCGGEVTLFFETHLWQRRSVVIFGAGHVGQALAGLAPWMDADVLVIDGREEREIQPPVPAKRPWELRAIDAPEGEVDAIPAESCVVIMTHSHALDLEVLARALRRGGFPYLGLIGSERKWQRFQARLRQRGVDEAALASVVCPLGGRRTSKEPRSIALATASEIVDVLAEPLDRRSRRLQ